MSISIEQDPSTGSWVTAKNIRLGFGVVLGLVVLAWATVGGLGVYSRVGLPAHVAALDELGTIVAVNSPWETIAQGPRAGALIGGSVGDNYLQVCAVAARGASRAVAEAIAGLQRVVAGLQEQFDTEYACEVASTTHWRLPLRASASPVASSLRPRL